MESQTAPSRGATGAAVSAWSIVALRSRGLQIIALASAFLSIAMLHRQNDGLWFSDATRHAVNGLFWWDLVTTVPHDPVEFTLRYYARYPVINPAPYPPLFYLLEGAVFAIFGPSPQAAKLLVLSFGGVCGLYTIGWARRWIAHEAGWTGPVLAAVPGFVIWSNAIMLNVPAAALSVASLYHFRRWSEDSSGKQLIFSALFFFAVLLTYYPAAIVAGILVAWGVYGRRGLRLSWAFKKWMAVCVLGLVPLVAALVVAPVHTFRHIPTLAFLTSPNTWTFYWVALPRTAGPWVVVFGFFGILVGMATRRWRTESCYLGMWIAVPIMGLSILPARDSRYVLLLIPACLLGAALGVAVLVRHTSRVGRLGQLAALLSMLVASLWVATHVRVPNVSGFREVAAYLRDQVAKESVLYDGGHDGHFGFYLRAFDPQFQSRMVRADRLLYNHGPTTTFHWTQKSFVKSTDDVIDYIRTRCGCRWVAIEVDRRPIAVAGRRLLREAVTGAQFQLARSFPIHGAGERRVDLYRFTGPVEPVTSVDLNFPAFSDRTFVGIAPITR